MGNFKLENNIMKLAVLFALGLVGATQA